MYDADLSHTLISKVTDAIKEQVTGWQNRQLDALYPIVYLDCIVVKIRYNGSFINKAVFLALGINTEGQKELLGMWLAENEGAKFWLSVLTELKNRGLQDILIACVDGLKGFPDAINSVYRKTHIQLCIIHMVRNSLKYVSWKDYKAVTSGLKRCTRLRHKRRPLWRWITLQISGTINTRRSVKAGGRTGKISIRSSTIHPISVRPSTRRMPLSR